MLQSSLNFAVGFFGLPLEGKYQQSITIESRGVGMIVAGFYSSVDGTTDKQYLGAVYDVSIAQVTSIFDT
jgi:hypothetical protein